MTETAVDGSLTKAVFDEAAVRWLAQLSDDSLPKKLASVLLLTTGEGLSEIDRPSRLSIRVLVKTGAISDRAAAGYLSVIEYQVTVARIALQSMLSGEKVVLDPWSYKGLRKVLLQELFRRKPDSPVSEPCLVRVSNVGYRKSREKRKIHQAVPVVS